MNEGDTMIKTLEQKTANRQLRFNGIHHATISTDKEDILNAYVQFVYHHTNNDIEMYENMASHAPLIEQKQLFLQLACRKKEVLLKLKGNLPVSTAGITGRYGKKPASSLTRFILDLDSMPLLTVENAINFAYWRENKTLALYEKLQESAVRDSLRLLFDVLVASGREHIDFITRYIAGGPVHPVTAGSSGPVEG
jgi:rubrerythrin